jgi:F5/8 type C domain-containing protein
MKNLKPPISFEFIGLFLVVMLFASSAGLGRGLPLSSFAASSLNSCNQAQINGLSASASDPNFPVSAVTDQNAQTIWSTYGKGSWIQLDLGTVKNLCSVDIAWYKGDQRQNKFIISISKDGSSYKTVFDSSSSGSTASFERYDLQNAAARYVKITVNGNSQNNYASITDVKVNAIGGGGGQSLPVEQTGPNSISSTDCTKAKISKVSASGHFKNYVPSNVLDNKPSTRWVNQQKPSSITLDLGSSKTVCNVDIQWFRGEFRVYNFIISVSKDNKKFKDVLKTKSSGSTGDPESYDFADVSTRYVRITVNGNSENNYASIEEIDVKTTGSGSGTSPPPNPNPTPNPNPNPNPNPTPNPASDGVQMIYPTAPGGDTWFFNPDKPDDGRFDQNGANIKKNTDGSWHLPPGVTRMNVFTKSAGLLSDQQRSNLATYDYSELASKGYWYNPSDWKNTEVTGYFKVTSTSAGDGISFVTRSVRHSNSIQDGCGGSAYHNNINFDGSFQYKKEMWHVNYDILPPTKNGIGSIMNKWVGFKGVVYNLPDGNVKLESYVDKDNTNHWQKVEELIDTGHWGNDMTHCNAQTPGAIITWASPMIIFKSTGVTYDFKKLSAREISPPQS